jgi:HSP20 family protein
MRGLPMISRAGDALLSDMDRSMGDVLKWKGMDMSSTFSPKADIVEGEKAYTLTLDVPGIKKEDISVGIEDNILTISGERKIQRQDREKSYSYYERSSGKFERSFKLPDTIDANKIDGTYENGVLSLALPKKKEESRTHKINIK